MTLLKLVLHVTDPKLVDRLGVRLRLVYDSDAGNEEAIVLEERLQVHADPPAGDEIGVAAGGQARGRLSGEGEQVAHSSASAVPDPAPVKRLKVIGGINWSSQ